MRCSANLQKHKRLVDFALRQSATGACGAPVYVDIQLQVASCRQQGICWTCTRVVFMMLPLGLTVSCSGEIADVVEELVPEQAVWPQAASRLVEQHAAAILAQRISQH